jgi:hypothetical protein
MHAQGMGNGGGSIGGGSGSAGVPHAVLTGLHPALAPKHVMLDAAGLEARVAAAVAAAAAAACGCLIWMGRVAVRPSWSVAGRELKCA